MADSKLELLIDIRSRLDELTKASAEMARFGQETTSAGQALKTGFGVDIARRGIDLLTSSLRESVGQAFRLAGQLKDTSEALGMTTTAYQVLALEFRAAGADAGRLSMAISAQTQSLAAARDGASDAASAYRSLGLNASEIELLPVEQRLIAVARAAINAKDQVAAFDAAGKILGSRGLPQLLNALRRLSDEGVPALEALYKAQYQIMDDDTIKRVDDAYKVWEKLWNGIVVGSASAISALDRFRVSATKDFLGTMVDFFAAGPMGTNIGPLLARMAIDNPKQDGPPPPDPKAIIEAQARAASVEAEKNAAKQRTAAAEQEAKRLQEIADWRANLSRERVAELQKEGDAIRKSVLTPTERYSETVARLSQLAEQGVIDFETLQRAVKAAYAEMAKTEPQPPSEDSAFRPQTRAQYAWERFSGMNDPQQNLGFLTAGQGVAVGAGEWVADLGSKGEQVADLMRNTIGAAVDAISDGIYGWITGTMSFGEAMMNLGATILRMILQTIVQMGVQMLVNAVIGRALQAAAAATAIAAAAATAGPLAAVWAGPATLATIATMGTAAAQAPASIALAKATVLGTSVAGFAAGGYTGDIGRSDVAGVVHGQEYVLNAAATRSLGVGFLDQVNRLGAIPAGAPIAPVSAGAPVLSGSGATGGAMREKPTMNFFVDNRDIVDRLANHANFKVVIRDMITGDPGFFGLPS
jgi:hypothetical protein